MFCTVSHKTKGQLRTLLIVRQLIVILTPLVAAFLQRSTIPSNPCTSHMCSCGIGGFCTGAVVGSAYTCTTIMKHLKQLSIEAHPCDIKFTMVRQSIHLPCRLKMSLPNVLYFHINAVSDNNHKATSLWSSAWIVLCLKGCRLLCQRMVMNT